MLYKLIAADLDGTLLDAEKEIPEKAKKAILSARNKGAIIVLCTGRTRSGALRYYRELGLDTLFIVSGGAEVFNRDGVALFSRYIDPNCTSALLNYASGNKIHAQVYVGEELVIMRRNKFSEMYEKRCGIPATVDADIIDKKISTPKVLFIDEPERITEIRQEVTKLFPSLSIKRSDPMYLEFFDPGTCKGKALAFAAHYYKIRRDEIIAIGDSEIDMSMLEFAGLAVAVSNADSCVKENADIICASNEQSGIAEIIEKYF